MKHLISLLDAHKDISDFKISTTITNSKQLFFVKGKLETVRSTCNTDREVTVYVRHGEYLGDSQFFVYASTSDREMAALVDDAAQKAMLICNKAYTLPGGNVGSFTVESNFQDKSLSQLAKDISREVFAANTLEHAGLNSVEVFVNKVTEHLVSSTGLDLTQVHYNAMVEAIPTYNGEKESVELYQQYNFSTFDAASVRREIGEKLLEVQARYQAVKPETVPSCPVVLEKQQVAQLMGSISRDLNYSNVYHHSNLYSKGDAVQQEPVGDRISITMAGQIPGCIRSRSFDGDGMLLNSQEVVKDGIAVGYYGPSRFGQYLGETPTGNLPCMDVALGTAGNADLSGSWLQVISMSGLQVDLHNDYIGGEVRLAYYHQGDKMVPMTGISIAGKVSQVLKSIRLWDSPAVYGGYRGPARAILQDMQVF